MQVKEIMKTEVKTCSPSITAQKVGERMVKEKVGSLIVTKDDTRVLGIVTDGDLVRDIVAKGLDPKKVKVSKIMTKEVVMIGPELTIQEAVDVMLEKGIKKLPVLQGNRLIGIVSMMDICTIQPKLVERFSSMFGATKGKRVAG